MAVRKRKDWECQIKSLVKEIDNLMDMHGNVKDVDRLPKVREELTRLYNSEEVFRAQRSRVRWLKEGDRNTRIFHVRSSHRARKNHIEGFMNGEGNWVTNIRDVFNVARDYFQELFMFDCDNNTNNILCLIPRCITREMNLELLKLVEEKEIMTRWT